MSRHPELVEYSSQDEYRQHFESIYCRGPIETFDGILVRFRKSNFDHAFFETVEVNDDTFSIERAKRVDWIQWTLKNPRAELYIGWNKKKKRQDKRRRVAIVNGDYVVIIRIAGHGKAEFITAFVAENNTIGKIRLNGQWTKKYR